MGVRIKLKMTSLEAGLSSEVNALLNTGFESEGPEVVVPARVAEKLGFWPQLPQDAASEEYEAAGGSRLTMYYLAKAIEVQAITEDKASKPIKCALVISEREREVLVSDRAIEELRIIIESPGTGLWRFKGEEKVRSSVAPQ